MKNFQSLASEFEKILTQCMHNPTLHAKWLNTLSYLENCGARKIAACQHPTLVREEILKHAAEEFRHAHYLKRQIKRVYLPSFPDYSKLNLLGGSHSLHYLNRLDLNTSRYLKTSGLSETSLREASYLLVTFAIELRAAELYPLYEKMLRQSNSKVTVQSILLEEKGHLKEMEESLSRFPNGFKHAEEICLIEGDLCQQWVTAITQIS